MAIILQQYRHRLCMIGVYLRVYQNIYRRNIGNAYLWVKTFEHQDHSIR
jgi:hypothetical protein